MAKSIMQNDNSCYLCGSSKNLECHHVINGNPGRKLSEKHGLKVKLCQECHKNVHADVSVRWALKRRAQIKWMEKNKKRISDFVSVFGKNYIDEEWSW